MPRISAFALVALLLCPVPSGADEPRLPAYNADIAETSISGISSGAFMAVQFATAWSSVIKGVGVVAGGPFWCAQADAGDAFDAFSVPFLNATGLCMSGQPLADLDHLPGRPTRNRHPAASIPSKG